MADVTVKSIMETELQQVLTQKPELSKEINAIVHFDISGDQGGTWTLDCTQSPGQLRSGSEGASKMTVYCSDADFVKLRKKELNPQMAAMQGKLKFKPMDMGLAMKLGKLLLA